MAMVGCTYCSRAWGSGKGIDGRPSYYRVTVRTWDIYLVNGTESFADENEGIAGQGDLTIDPIEHSLSKTVI